MMAYNKNRKKENVYFSKNLFHFSILPFSRVVCGKHTSVSHDEGGSHMEEKKFILTISRRYGCGGRELANILAEKLGVHLYDRQIVHLAARMFASSRPPQPYRRLIVRMNFFSSM